MITIVPDTVTMLRGLLSHQNNQRKILNLALAKRIRLFGSNKTFLEFCEKIKEPQFEFYLKLKNYSYQKVIDDYKSLVVLMEPSPEFSNLHVSPDPDDDILFQIAKTYGIKIIVSEDKSHVLAVKYEDVRTIPSDLFIELYSKNNGGKLY